MTYTVISVQIYTVLEPTLGIVNTCLPTIKPAILTIRGKRLNPLNTPPRYMTINGAPSSKRKMMGNHEQDITLVGTQNFGRMDNEVPLTGITIQGDSGEARPEYGTDIAIERRWMVETTKNTSDVLK